MSDTTITPRKRKELREYALDCKGEMNRNYFIRHLEPDTVLDLLDTIEQAESRIDVDCIEDLKRAAALAEQAEARAERAEAMVDWLAGQLHGLGSKYGDVICPQEKCHATSDCIDCWKEAARRAVAAGEEPCQK